MGEPLPGPLDVPRVQGLPDGPRLAPEGGPADHGPGGGGGQRDGSGTGGAYGTGGDGGEAHGPTGTDDGVQRAPPAVVPPQHPLHDARGPPERGDRMPAAGIAQEQVADEPGGGAVREDAIGTHGVSPPSGEERPRAERTGEQDPQRAAAHGDMSSLRVSTPWFDETGGESSWLPGTYFPGDSGGTAPDSHRLPLLPPYLAPAVHHGSRTPVNLLLTWDGGVC
nr:hypothetical protein SAVMC3_72910 [Streptomyces avermitilis]